MNEEALIAVVVAIVSSAGFWSVVSSRIGKHSAVNQALGALLRHSMYEIYDTYKDASAVPTDVLEEMDSLHEAYHALGYNHMGDKIHKQIMDKPAC